MGAIWAVLRLCGIIVGIATLLRLATLGFHVEYKEFFQAFLDQVRNIVELGFLIDPLEKLVLAFLDWVRKFGWHVPDLQPFWKAVLTIWWLLLAAVARNFPGGNVAFQLTWAFVCALGMAVAVGTQHIASAAIAAWPFATYFLFYAGLRAPDYFGQTKAAPETITFLSWLIGAAGFVVAGFLVGPLPAISGVDIPGLLFLVVLVCALALSLVYSGLLRQERTMIAAGLDVLGVVGGALAVGYAMLK